MRVRQTFAAVMLFLSAFAVDAAAQTAGGRRVDVFAVAGPTWMWEDEGYLGPAVEVGAGVGYRAGRVSFEALANFRRHQPDFNDDVVFRARVGELAGRVLYHFGSRRAQPFVGGSVGAKHVDRLSEFPDDCRLVNHAFVCEGVERFESAGWSSALTTFGGVRVSINERWFIRPEFGIEWPGLDVTLTALVAVGRSW